MVFRAIRTNERFLVALSRSPGRISIADYTQSRLYQDIELEASCDHVFDVTADGRYLAAGYDYVRGIDVWDLATGERFPRFGPGDVNSVRFDATGCFLLVTKNGLTKVYRWRDQSIVETLKYCENVQRGASLNANANTMLVPTQRRGLMYQVGFDPLSIATAQLSAAEKVWKTCWSPDCRRLITITEDDRIRCCCNVGGDPLWAIQLDRGQCIGECGFSGDGGLLGVWISGGRAGPQGTIVLDAATGRMLHTIPRQYGGDWPFEGTKVMTENGIILDLANGTADDTVSRAAYWRSIGLQF